MERSKDNRLIIISPNTSKCMVFEDEHIIQCSECGRNLIVKDNVNNAMAFLSHLKLDHGITYVPQRLTKDKTKGITRLQLQKMDS